MVGRPGNKAMLRTRVDHLQLSVLNQLLLITKQLLCVILSIYSNQCHSNKTSKKPIHPLLQSC